MTDIAKAWQDFMFSQIHDRPHSKEDSKLPIPHKYYVAFGKAMAKIIEKDGQAYNGMWDEKTPSGTEDRLWYRTWLALHNHPNHNYVLNLGGSKDSQFDDRTMFNMAYKFYELAAVWDCYLHQLIQEQVNECCLETLEEFTAKNGMFELFKPRKQED